MSRYRFGQFTLDVTERQLFNAGVKVVLEPKHLDLLILLATRSPHLVSKDELLGLLWPDTYVNEEVLNACVSVLRKALARIIHEGRLTSLFNGRIELFVARGGTVEAMLGLPTLTHGDFGTAMSA